MFLTFIRWHKETKKKASYELNEDITASDDHLKTDQGFDLNAVMNVLNLLSEEKQEIVKLRFWGDLKFSEIAEQINKSEVAVKKMFYRTIEEVKNKLN